MKRHRITRWAALIVLIAGFAGMAAILPQAIHAQSLPDWTEPFRPALLPDFVGDMAIHADAPRYTMDLALDVGPNAAIVTGHQEVLYTNETAVPLPDIVFRLYPNLESYGGVMQVSRVTVEGIQVAPTLDNTRSVMTLTLPEPLAPGASVSLEMEFSITIMAGRERLYGQFSYLDGVLALPNAYPVLSVYEPGEGWWQVTDHPQGDAVFSPTAFYTVRVTAPTGLILAASGSEVDLIANADGTLTHHYVAPLMRDFALFASEDYVTVTGEQDGVTVTVYYDPAYLQTGTAAQAGLRMTLDSLRIYNAEFGLYPFREMDVVMTPTNAGGIEYPGVFVVANNLWDEADNFFEFVIAHEASHQWWYSLVGNDQTLDPWIDEALAQYSVAVYIRDLKGERAYRGALGSFDAQYERYILTHDDEVIGLPVSDYPGQAYFYMVYQKGPLLYAALDAEYGYEGVNQMLRDFFAAYRYEIARPADLLASFELTSGADLNPLFEEWVGTIPVG